jgi:uncharacterized protein
MTGAESAYGEISLLTYGIIALAAFAGTLLASMSGTGSGLLLAPILVPLIGVKALLPVIAVGSLLGNIARAWVYRDWIDWRLFLRIGLPSVPGVFIGVLIYEWMPQTILLAVVGAFIIASIPLRRWADTLEIKPSPAGMVGCSFGFGVISGSLPAGGIVLIAMLLGMGIRGGAILGTDAAISILTNLCRVGGFSTVDLLNTQLVIIGCIIGAVTVPAAYIGRFLVVRIGIKVHTMLLDTVVALTGIYFIYEATRAWLFTPEG